MINRQTMISRAFMTALSEDLPVLFAYIGWANKYNGIDEVYGGHRYLQDNPHNNSESQGFVKGGDGFFRCGMGSGQAPTFLHIVFVAEDPETQTKKLVGVYAAGIVEVEDGWAVATTKHAVLIPRDRRPRLSAKWPGMQGIRRWGKGGNGKSHPLLGKVFERLKADLPTILKRGVPQRTTLDQTYVGMEAREGEEYQRLVMHRKRESKLRTAKIRQALSANGGRLKCEVPRCGFDFVSKYGELGYAYAQVHHRTPLAKVGKKRKKTTLADLAIVCANCHAMVHLGGECRELANLISRKRKVV
jgi:5-methylcytosine-specific restriction endonuclease McrA